MRIFARLFSGAIPKPKFSATQVDPRVKPDNVRDYLNANKFLLATIIALCISAKNMEHSYVKNQVNAVRSKVQLYPKKPEVPYLHI